jgi:hypothetical protein
LVIRWASAEAGVRRLTARPVLVTLPVDPAGSYDPHGLVTRPRPPPPASRWWWYGSSSPTDPALPGGSAWEKFYGPAGRARKGCSARTSTYSGFPRILHRLSGPRPQTPRRCPQETVPPVDEWSRPVARRPSPSLQAGETTDARSVEPVASTGPLWAEPVETTGRRSSPSRPRDPAGRARRSNPSRPPDRARTQPVPDLLADRPDVERNARSEKCEGPSSV